MRQARLSGMGYETSCPTTLLHWLRAADEMLHLTWEQPDDRLQFTINYLMTVATFYLREKEYHMCDEVNKLRTYLRSQGDVRRVAGELMKLERERQP